MEKQVKRYAKYYRSIISKAGLEDIDERVQVYEERLKKMYASDDFKMHNVYPSMSVDWIYAVIVMCQMLKEYGLNKDEIMDLLNDNFEDVYRTAKKVIKAIDRFVPCTFALVKLWNTSDHKDRLKDGSISYEYFNVEANSISYKINRCMYKEIFEYYGLTEYCKIFCNTDTMAYDCLTKHVKFIRYEDLSDGKSCHDEILKK